MQVKFFYCRLKKWCRTLDLKTLPSSLMFSFVLRIVSVFLQKFIIFQFIEFSAFDCVFLVCN